MLLSEILQAIVSLFRRPTAHATPPTPSVSSTAVEPPTEPPTRPAPPATPVPQTKPAAAPSVVPVVPVSASPALPQWLVLCLPLTKHSESCQLIAYCDPASPRGKALRQAGLWSAYLADRSIGDRPAYASLDGTPWTCGWGSTGSDVTKKTIWTQPQADARLVSQLLEAGAAVDRHVTVDITPAQKAALADFVFNEGEERFASSTLLHKLNASDFVGAANEFARWDLAGGQVLNGLVERRAGDRQLFTVGAWTP